MLGKLLLSFAIVAAMFSGVAVGQCVKNLEGLTLKQFDTQTQNIFNEVDNDLRKSNTYYYNQNGTAYARERTASVDVTRERNGVVSYSVCRLNSIGIPTWLVYEDNKVFLRCRIYIVY